MPTTAITIRAALIRFLIRIRQLFFGMFSPRPTPSPDAHPDDHGQSFFRAVIENALDFVTIINEDGIIVYESPSVTRLLGYESTDLVGRSVFDFIHPEDLSTVLKTFRVGVKVPGFVGDITCRFLHKDGTWRTLEATGKNLLDNPVISGIVVNSRDVTDRRKIERENKMLAHTLESVRECVSITDLEDTILYVNKAFLTTYGYEEQEVLGKNISMVRSESNPEGLVEEILPKTKRGAWEGELFNRRKDGSEFPVQLSTTTIKDEDENAVALMGLARDITGRHEREARDRKSMETIFRQNEALREIGRMEFTDVENARQRIIEIDAGTLEVERVSIWSFEQERKRIVCEDLFIRSTNRHEMGLRFDTASFPEYFAALTQDRLIAATDARVDGRTSELSRTYLVPNDIVSMLDVPIVLDGRIVGILCHEQTGERRRWTQEEQEFAASVADRIALTIEAAERMKVEKELRGALSLLTATLDATTDGILVVDNDGRIVSYNRRFVKMWGIPYSVLSSKDDNAALAYVTDKLVAPDEFVAKVRRLYKDPDAESYDILEFKDGRTFERFSAPQRIEGKSVGRVWSFRDVTQRREAEKGLRESELKYRALFTNVLDGVYRSTPDGKLITANPAFVKMLGYESEAELKELDITHDLYVEPEIRDRWRLRVEKEGIARNTEVELRRKDGSRISVLENSYAVKDPEGKVQFFEGTVTDISDRTKAQRELVEQKERYRQFFEEDLTGDFVSTPEGQILDCNPAFARIFGYDSVAEAMASPAISFYPRPDARRNLLALLRRKRRLEGIELEARSKDGRPVYVIENMYGIFDDKDELVQVRGYLFDNTERRRLEEEFRQAQKMDSVGTLAGGIAHDFNNILAIILAYASSARRGGDVEKLTKSAEGIVAAAERGAGLVRQLLTIARKAAVDVERVNANDILRDLGKLIRETFPRTIEFDFDLADDLPEITADPNQINQVLLNLCVNARDAMPDGGTIRIASSVIDAAIESERIASAVASTYVCVSVSDTGSGMDEQTRRRIFEPFFTTKSREHGTGLGLAVVYGIVKAHSGEIHVDSAPGTGTTFTVYLPIAETDSQDVIASRDVDDEVEGGTETILLVEDEKVLQAEVAEELQARGYSVLTADDGLDAVDTFRKNQGSVDLIIMDIGLPKLSGWDAVKSIQAMDPTARIVIASGYFSPDLKPEMLKAGIRSFVQKPYHLTKLLTEIRSALTSGE